MTTDAPHIHVEQLTMAYGSNLIQQELTFDVNRGDVFVIMGGSGCGKSTLLKHMIGLYEPAVGDIFYAGRSFNKTDDAGRFQLRREWGITYQSGGLFSAMTLAENTALPLQQYTKLGATEIADIVAYKLALVGLAGYQDYYPSEISGGMQKRAGLARAIALDPDILFFDEPSAGLDPISSQLLDELILQMKESLGATVVIVTHELASIFAIANNSVFLDAETKTMIAYGDPKQLREDSSEEKVRRFLARGKSGNGSTA
ncbi:ABC transporter ATP-binding protein [Candidatus Litorirhabdus singularis]|nr:ATP-binding cassette domain-containing protein [Candidatus Litorirhabdus singularis]